MHTTQIQNPPRGTVKIVFAELGELARTVISRSNCKVTFKVPSFKTGTTLYAESRHECDFIRRCDVDPVVRFLIMQPAALYYWDDDVLRTHYPDCLVKKITPSETFVEIKSATDPKLDEARHRGDLVSPSLLEQGYGYEVVTSAEINVQPHLSNAQTLLRLGRKAITAIEAEKIRLGLIKRPNTTWRDVVQGSLGPDGAFQVARMILDGVLCYDATKLLGRETVIYPAPTRR